MRRQRYVCDMRYVVCLTVLVFLHFGGRLSLSLHSPSFLCTIINLLHYQIFDWYSTNFVSELTIMRILCPLFRLHFPPWRSPTSRLYSVSSLLFSCFQQWLLCGTITRWPGKWDGRCVPLDLFCVLKSTASVSRQCVLWKYSSNTYRTVSLTKTSSDGYASSLSAGHSRTVTDWYQSNDVQYNQI